LVNCKVSSVLVRRSFRPARTFARTLVFAIVAALGGCGGDDDGPIRVVLLVDEGIDPSAPDLRRTAIAAYTVRCAPPPERPGTDAGAAPPLPLEDDKAKLIASLQVRDESCRLEEGISEKQDPLPGIARYRERWNKMIRASRYANGYFDPAESAEIAGALEHGFDTQPFHGTATAGVIAYQNDRVWLVLVERQLGNFADVMKTFQCLQQEDVDRTVALYSDPDVRAAYVGRPPSTFEEDMRNLYSRHGVQIANESFGHVARQTLEDLQVQKQCAPVNLRPYFSTWGTLFRTQAEAAAGDGTLLVRAAGNSSTVNDGGEDSIDCFEVASRPQLVIGSTDLLGARSPFTSFGRCVDAYAPGESVIAPVPGGWLMPLFGTSFSAPLVTRMVTLAGGPPTFSAAEARDAVLAARDSTQAIPRRRFPARAFYDPQRSGQALTAEAAIRPRVAARVDTRALGELLLPLRAVRPR
jgi:hypothetical protein